MYSIIKIGSFFDEWFGIVCFLCYLSEFLNENKNLEQKMAVNSYEILQVRAEESLKRQFHFCMLDFCRFHVVF
jgi:hypothetical protein